MPARARRCPAATRRGARRDAAFSLFERFGLPHRRVEAWKYTDLRTLMRSVAAARRRRAGRLARGRRRGRPARRARPRPDRHRQRRLRAGAVRSRRHRGRRGRAARRTCSRPRRSRIGRLFDDGDDRGDGAQHGADAGRRGGDRRGRARSRRGRSRSSTSPRARSRSRSITRNVVVVGEGASVRFIESHRGRAGLAYQVNALDRTRRRRRCAACHWARLQTESEAAQHISPASSPGIGERRHARPPRGQFRCRARPLAGLRHASPGETCADRRSPARRCCPAPSTATTTLVDEPRRAARRQPRDCSRPPSTAGRPASSRARSSSRRTRRRPTPR